MKKQHKALIYIGAFLALLSVQAYDKGMIFPQEDRVYSDVGLNAVQLSEAGDHQNAIKGYTEALRSKPKKAILYLLRMMEYTEIEDYDKALSDGKKVIELAKEDSSLEGAYIMFAGIYHKMGERDLCVKNIQKAAKINPKYKVELCDK